MGWIMTASIFQLEADLLYRLSQKMITGLSASITFKIMNQSKYALGFWNYNYVSAFCQTPHPIWFSSHEEIRIFVRYYVISPFHPSFDSQQTHTPQWTLNSTLLLNGLCRLCTKLGWKAVTTNKTNIPISPWLLNQSDGVFGKMQIISYSFKILKWRRHFFFFLLVSSAGRHVHDDIPLPHYDNFGEIFLKSEGSRKAVTTNKTNIPISPWLLNQSDGVFGKMQIISYSFKILKWRRHFFFLLVSSAGRHVHDDIPLPHYDNFGEIFLKSEKKFRSPPPPPPPLISLFSTCATFRAGGAAAVARHFAPPKQTSWRRPCLDWFVILKVIDAESPVIILLG